MEYLNVIVCIEGYIDNIGLCVLNECLFLVCVNFVKLFLVNEYNVDLVCLFI